MFRSALLEGDGGHCIVSAGCINFLGWVEEGIYVNLGVVAEVGAVGDIEGDHEGVEGGAELVSAKGGLGRAGLDPEVGGGGDGLAFENGDGALGKYANNDEDDEEGDEEAALVCMIMVVADPPELGVGKQTKLGNHLLIKSFRILFF